ncbi:putative ATP-dependent RNA helicase SoYb [Calliphora vicina]|uniref:putative ATP-dependent RNA helicase SoYb n=1 Tax=Calliphora vicina TaxID=7373 RepID=UPI00325B219D
MESDHRITVTHFINPHLFWYKAIGAPDEQFHVLSVFEQTLVELYKNKPSCDNFLRPEIGDKVACNFIAWNKYIRAEILQKAEFQQEEYIVWAIDYGFPLLTKKEHLRNLPSNLQLDIGHIQIGGIENIYPAEQEYDDVEGNLVMIKKDKWLQKTCNMLEKLLADANSISFAKHFQTDNNHAWGDLIIVNHKGIKINARDYLLKTTNAIEEHDLIFKETCSKFKTTKIAPWLSNDRNTKMKFNNIKHNYIDHSKQMNATLIDENAKRKVEDWQERNERKKVEAVSEQLETSCEISEDNIDDVTFDDSVSVANNQQVNFIGKAGILTKIKQQKYSSEKDLPPLALPKSFEIDNILFDLNWPTEPPPSYSTRSGSTNVSSRLQKLAQLSKSKMTKDDKPISASAHLNIHSQPGPLIDLGGSTASSTVSSVKLRQQKLSEMRKKAARAEKELKLNEPTTVHRPTHNYNETTNSTLSQSKTSDSYSYQLLEQTLSTINNTTTDNIQDNKSEISVKNIRAKQLIAMRKKFVSSTIASSNDGSQINTPTESLLSTNITQYKSKQQESMDKSNISSFNTLDFQLKSKISSKPEGKIMQSNEIYSLATPSTNTAKDRIKLSQSGYDSFTMVPAGYDITRLQTYKDEENHWHRKKSTRHDCVPHDQTSSTDELLSNNTNDQSFSSSDFFQVKPPKAISQTSAYHSNPIPSLTKKTSINSNTVLDTQVNRCSQQQEVSNEAFEIKGIGDNYLSSEVSTSTNSTIPSQKLRKRRQLKSPTSQLSKIDKILQEHNIEKEMGNTNILDLKLLNTSSSSQKSLLGSTSSNASCNDKHIPPVVANSSTSHNGGSRSSSSVDKIRNEKVSKEVFNYEALMDVKHTEHLPIVEGERKIQSKFIDHLVLAHSSIQLTAIENVSEAPFLPEIHEEMRQMRVNKVYRIQVYAWSHVLRSNSLFVVNPSRSGKTWSYLPPLCSLICCRAELIKPSYGPVAIILVASLKHVEMVSNYCRRLMSGLKNEAPTCVPSYGMRNLIETKVQLLNGCGILVATPSSVLRLLHENVNEPLFDAERIQHIVIDDMDIMMSRSQQDLENASRILFKMAKKSKFEKLSPQLIVTSRDWDRPMVKLIRKSNQPLLLIGDFLEAAVYGQATLSVKLKSSAEKNDTILKFIINMSNSAQGSDNRTLIMCNEDEDVQNVVKFLQDCGHHCIGFYSRSTDNERVTIDEWKMKLSSQILVCTDARFCELKIQNVNNLIHYSMPTSWTRFTTRFSALSRTYNNYVSRNFEQTSALSTAFASKKHCAHSMILLDENNSLQLPRLVDFMRKHNQTVHDEILAVSRRVLIAREEQRILNGSLLCPQLLEFGECDEPRCDNRHELTRFDIISKSAGIPSSGEIRIHILKVFSPTHYAVRLLHHKLPNTTKWVEVRRSSEALTFSVQLNMHYSNEGNLFLHWPPHINDLCIYQYAENFRRARILEAPIFEQKSTNVVQSNLKVTLRLIDDGTIISSVKCNEIFVCDDKFKDFPPQAVDVRLMNIVPFDNERTWDSKTTKQVQKWIMEDIKSNYVVQASIDFSLTNTIWVKNVVVMEKLTGIDAYCQVVHLKKSLIEKNFGVLYKGDRKQVRDLAEEFGLLNVCELDVDNSDSDFDFQSCKNESINFIKFSSSNDEAANSSMESAKNDLEPIKKIEDGNTTKQIVKTTDVEMQPNDVENWDDQWDSGREGDKDFVPLSTNDLHKTSKLDEDNIKIKSMREADSIPPKKETWSQLPLNEIVKVEIGDEGENGNWENIFLQIIDKSSMFMFDELNKLIVKHVESIKSGNEKQKEIYDFKPLHNCIVRYNNLYLRAKVYGVFGEQMEQRLYRFFLCDYACFTNAKTEELYNDFLYETTDEIVTFTPYQAIHCTLAGLKWDRFNKRYQVTKDYLYACAVLESHTNEKDASNLQNLPMNSYKILLYECDNENEFETALLLNKILVDNGITVYDEETKNFLEYEIGMEAKNQLKSNGTLDVKEEEIVNVSKTYNKDEVLTYEQLMDFIKADAFDIELDDMMEDIQKSAIKGQNNNAVDIYRQRDNKLNIDSDKNENISDKMSASDKKANTKVLKEKSSDSEIDEQGHCTSYSNSSIKSSTSLSSTDISNCSIEPVLPKPPALITLHKRPATTWYENDCMIFISIHAPDITDYLLEVTSKTILFVAEIQSEKSVLILNLLGSIDPQCVSHEIKGLNVVIRLKKIVFEKWPRLLREATKYSWLKYNFNSFDSIDLEYIMPQRRLHTILDNELNFQGQHVDNYNSDEDSERELYQTYNPIQDNDDCDPFSTF